jgi:hypothetical protein
MANSDKNILITPNTGSALNPTIAFTGSNASPITMSILDTGALSFSGTSGQLFSIVDSLSGSIFSVNDISGIPSLEILDTGLVKLNQYGGNTAIGVATPYTGLISSGAARLSISTISAATAGLIVKGKPSQSENLVEFYRSSADANAVFKIQAGLYPVYIDNLAVGSNVYSNYQIVGGAAVGNMGNYLHQFNSWNAAWVTVGVRGAASQSANLQEWQNSAGTAVAVVGNTGTIRSSIFANLTPSLTYIATNYDNNGVGIVITNSAYKGLVVRGVASQTADLQQWQNSSGFGVLNVLANGNIVLGNSNVADNNYIDFIKAGGGGTGGLAGIRFGSPTTQQTLTIDTGDAHLLLAHQNAASSFIVKGFTSQSANLQEWQDVAGGIRTAISPFGVISHGNPAAIFQNSGGIDSRVSISTVIATATGIIIRAVSSQTADLQQWQGAAGTVITSLSPGGTFSTSGRLVSNGSSGARLDISTAGAATVGAVIRGVASQTANLQEWQNSAGTIVARIGSTGEISTNNLLSQTGGLTCLVLGVNRNVALATNSPSNGGGAAVVFIGNATTVPTTDPTGGGIMYVEGGALKYRGSSGTVTTIANA